MLAIWHELIQITPHGWGYLWLKKGRYIERGKNKSFILLAITNQCYILAAEIQLCQFDNDHPGNQ